jgi:hypothetical protein
MRSLALLLLAATAHAETRTYVIAIGNNSPPFSEAAPEKLPELSYSDDDAADFYRFTRGLATRSVLLSVLDARSQRRFPGLAAEARPPSLAALREAVAGLRPLMEADRSAGRDPVLLFFYSGHGTRGSEAGPPALAMSDGRLTQAVLYDEVLAALPARFAHLFVDACHAEAIIRPRDLDAQTVPLTVEDVQTYAARTTLQRFPHVGAIIATASAAQAHEWDVYERGVFSHEILSALRGAADIDGDGRIEYSELSAFVAAANREVIDPRARIDVVVHPPALDRRAPIVDLKALHGVAHLSGRPEAVGGFFIEDDRGNRLVDLHSEGSHEVAVALPAGEPLYLRTYSRREATLKLAEGSVVRFAALKLRESFSSRGAIDASHERGLFATAYGPAYYRGFVDKNDELAAVPLQTSLVLYTTPPTRRVAGPALLGVGAGLAVAGVIFAGLTVPAENDFNGDNREAYFHEPNGRYMGYQAAAITSFAVAAVAIGVGSWLYVRHR